MKMFLTFISIVVSLAGIPAFAAHNPNECPAKIVGHYSAHDGEGYEIQIIITRNVDKNLTIGYFTMDEKGPAPSVVNGLNQEIRDAYGNLIANERLSCVNNTVLKEVSFVNSNQTSTYEWASLANGDLKLQPLSPSSDAIIYSRLK